MIKNPVVQYLKSQLTLAGILITRPAAFFRHMPRDGGLVEPLIFQLLATLLTVLVMYLGMAASHGIGISNFSMLLSQLVIGPVIAVLGGFFLAGAFFSVWYVLGSKQPFEVSYRCFAYTQTLLPITLLLSNVPYLALAGIVWWVLLMAIASREVHEVNFVRALGVFGAVGILTALIYVSMVNKAMDKDQRLKDFEQKLQEMPRVAE